MTLFFLITKLHQKFLDSFDECEKKEVENIIDSLELELNPERNFCGLCKKNSSDVDNEWIKCNKCKSWFHCKCVNVVPDDFPEGVKYFCSTCFDKDSKNVNGRSTPLLQDSQLTTPQSSPLCKDDLLVSSLRNNENIGSGTTGVKNEIEKDEVVGNKSEVVKSSSSRPKQGSGFSRPPNLPKHRSLFKLHPKVSKVVLSNSQLKPVHHMALDGSGCSQLFAIGRATLPEMFDMLEGGLRSSINQRKQIEEVVLFCGGNDVAQGRSVAEILSDYNKLFQQIAHVFPSCKLSVVPLLSRPDCCKTTVDKCNSKRKDFKLINLLNIPSFYHSYYRDQAHLNYNGLRKIVNIIQSSLNIIGHTKIEFIKPTFSNKKGLKLEAPSLKKIKKEDPLKRGPLPLLPSPGLKTCYSSSSGFGSELESSSVWK